MVVVIIDAVNGGYYYCSEWWLLFINVCLYCAGVCGSWERGKDQDGHEQPGDSDGTKLSPQQTHESRDVAWEHATWDELCAHPDCKPGHNWHGRSHVIVPWQSCECVQAFCSQFLLFIVFIADIIAATMRSSILHVFDMVEIWRSLGINLNNDNQCIFVSQRTFAMMNLLWCLQMQMLYVMWWYFRHIVGICIHVWSTYNKPWIVCVDWPQLVSPEWTAYFMSWLLSVRTASPCGIVAALWSPLVQ